MGLREISHPEIQASFQQDPPTSKLLKMGCLQYRGCLTSSPYVIGVLTFSLDRNDLVSHTFGSDLHIFIMYESFCIFFASDFPCLQVSLID